MPEEIPRDRRVAIPIAIIFALLFYGVYRWRHLNSFTGTLVGIAFAVVAALTYALVSYAGEGSKLYGWKPIAVYLPSVRRPEGHVHFKKKFLWTVLILILYFVLTNIYIWGVDKSRITDVFEQFRAILAGASGSIVHLGIGPIVTAGIIMELFVGAKIVNIDITKDEDRILFHAIQKLMIVFMILIEGIPQVFGYLSPDGKVVAMLGEALGGHGLFWARTIIVVQLVVGSYLLYLMDEVVSKWGIGSGISLFIAAGVSQSIITGLVNWVPVRPGEPLSLSNPPSGVIPKTIYLVSHMSASDLAAGGLERILIAPPNSVFALISTIFIFFLVAYLEGAKIELPLAHEYAGGIKAGYPLKLMYVSVIPVILTSALLANVQMWALLFWTNPTLSKIPILGRNPIIGVFPTAVEAQRMGISQTTPIGGIAYYLSTPRGIHQWLLPLIDPERYSVYLMGHTVGQMLLHIVAYSAFMMGMSVLFGLFWVETANMGPSALAEQLVAQGLRIPRIRADKRSIERFLKRYIPPLTLFSSLAIGGLAVVATLLGTIGRTSGTGLLLLVSIMMQFYEALGREELMEMHPVLRSFVGG